MTHACVSLHMHGACKDRMHTHASRMHMHIHMRMRMHMHMHMRMMHMHASCNKPHTQHVHVQASMCFAIECRIDILCNHAFTDEDFICVRKIMLSSVGNRRYAELGTDFVDIPPHHIVIQGKFIRVFHREMRSAGCWACAARIKIVGLFQIKSPDGQMTEASLIETSDEEPALEDADIVAGVASDTEG